VRHPPFLIVAGMHQLFLSLVGTHLPCANFIYFCQDFTHRRVGTNLTHNWQAQPYLFLRDFKLYLISLVDTIPYLLPVNYGSGSNFLSSYGFSSGSGSTSQKVTVPTVPVSVPQRCLLPTLKSLAGLNLCFP